MSIQGPVDVSLHSHSVIEEGLPLIFTILSISSQKNPSGMTEDHLDRFETEMEVCEIMDIFPRGETGCMQRP